MRPGSSPTDPLELPKATPAEPLPSQQTATALPLSPPARKRVRAGPMIEAGISGPGGVDPQRGAGLIGTSAGLLVFWLLMLAAVQILFNLYATSMVTSAAYDAARGVAGFASAQDRCAAVPAAEASMLDTLGDYADIGDISLSWTCSDPESVRLRVTADHPTLLPQQMTGLRRLAHVDRTITVRLEEPR